MKNEETKTPNAEEMMEDKAIVDYFMSKKHEYKKQRETLETQWAHARAMFHNTDKVEKLYNGRSKIQIPVMRIKAIGILSRMMHILFNVEPFGRIESKKVVKDGTKTPVDLWNDYIFENQIHAINFKESYQLFTQDKIVLGTAVAKISQEYEEKKIRYSDELEEETVVVKDDTYFRNLLLEEFYTDSNKQDLQDSEMNSHSTVIRMEELIANKKRTIVEIEETVDQETGEVIDEQEVRSEEGFYINLHLLHCMDNNSLSEEAQTYIDQLGTTKGQARELIKKLKEAKKTGNIPIDECYGKYDLDGDGIPEEVLVTIAFEKFVIRKEPTPFIHKRYVRPFIAGRFRIIPNQFYGESNFTVGKWIQLEYNASRAQANDAKTFSIFPMLYEDRSRNLKWDRQWRPLGVIQGDGPAGITPIINPNLGNVAIDDSMLSEQALDQLWSLAPVQQGTSDRRNIPKTAAQTRQLIAQNDLVLNEYINQAVEHEIKPFIEMLYERDLTFKTTEDLLTVWDEDDIKSAGMENSSLRDLFIDMNVRILGNLELSNEVAHQQGYMNFIQTALQYPPLAKRINPTVFGEKLLRSHGIKDDAEGLFFPPEQMAQINEQENQAKQQQMQAQEQAIEKAKMDNLQEIEFKEQARTKGKIAEMSAEALIETESGVRVQ